MHDVCHPVPECNEGAGTGTPVLDHILGPRPRPFAMRTGRVTALVAAALVSGSPAVSQQSNAERILSGRDTPSHGYDLIHQRIEVGKFDWDATAFDGNVTTTIVSLRAGLDSVVLDMGRRLAVRTVKGARNVLLGFSRPGDSIVVRLPRPVGFRDTVRFTIDYHGRITHGRGLYFFKAEPGRPRRTQQVYSGGGTDGNPNWIPTYGAPNDKATWDLIARVPAGLTVVSNGRLVSDRPDPPARGAGAARRQRAATRTVHWRQERPASTYLLSFVAAPLRKVTDRWRDVPVEYYVSSEDMAHARRLFGVTPDMMETFSRLTRLKYPWGRYSQTTVTDFIGGMENVGATTLVDWVPDAQAYRDRPWYRHTLIPHELAHQWFGNLVTAENWSNYWLNEGMAEFMAGQYWATKHGRYAEDDFYLDEYRRFMAADARRRVPLASFNSNNVYTKGALVMQMLKKHLGPERFWASINQYLVRHSFANATSDDLRRAVLHATGENLDWFWDQWVYGTGYPELTVTSAYDSAAGALALTVRQTQADAARDSAGVRFATPLVFQGLVSVRVATSSGELRRRVRINRREQVVRVEGLKSEPNMVVFDESNALLKRLTFEQPTRWLANQLSRDASLWNRSWVIDQLAQRTADSLAGSALTRAALGADYYLTRAQAVAALRSFPAAVSLPPLQAAMRDTSAAVRETAVTTLGLVGGAQAQATVLNAWKRDSSYQVRASALTVLARLDSVGSRPRVLAGLRTRSYRNVIQTAAITAAARAPDSTLIEGLEKIIGEQQLPSLVLATLASGGDTHALTALVRHRNDPRPWVRRWVLDAIEQQLQKTP
jgi:aminopeptidase N